MNRSRVCAALAALAILGATASARAASQAEAVALVEKAAVYWKANGQAKAVAEINSPKGQFSRGDLYVFAYRLDGVVLANGRYPDLTGQNQIEITDAMGKQFIKGCCGMAKTKGSGWVEYIWINPITKKLQSRTVWVRRIEGTDAYVGSGVWKAAAGWP
jgi:cytochrome c